VHVQRIATVHVARSATLLLVYPALSESTVEPIQSNRIDTGSNQTNNKQSSWTLSGSARSSSRRTTESSPSWSCTSSRRRWVTCWRRTSTCCGVLVWTCIFVVGCIVQCSVRA